MGRAIVHSTSMPKRPLTALLAVLVLLLAAPTAFAQTPTATPGGAPDDASEAVKEIYSDYRNDGKIDVCTHERDDLQDALDTIEPDFDTDNPDFRAALEAGHPAPRRRPLLRGRGRRDPHGHGDHHGHGVTHRGRRHPAATGRRLERRRRRWRDPAPRGRNAPARGRGGDARSWRGDTRSLRPFPPSPRPSRPPPHRARRRRSSVSNGSFLIPAIVLGLALLCGLALLLFPLAARRNPSLDAACRSSGSAPA